MVKTKTKTTHSSDGDVPAPEPTNLKKKQYEKALAKYQVELVKQQKWIRETGLKVALSSKDGTRREKAAPSSGLRRASIRACAVWWRSVHPPNERRANGTSSATWLTFLLLAKWCCLIAAGTTEPVLSE